METNHIFKRAYLMPEIQQIMLDKDISLQLESNPPTLPNEVRNNLPNSDYFNNNPAV